MTNTNTQGTRVTAEDLATGQDGSVVIENNYVVITDGTCEVTSEQHYANGTVQITIKRPRPVRAGGVTGQGGERQGLEADRVGRAQEDQP